MTDVRGAMLLGLGLMAVALFDGCGNMTSEQQTIVGGGAVGAAAGVGPAVIADGSRVAGGGVGAAAPDRAQ